MRELFCQFFFVRGNAAEFFFSVPQTVAANLVVGRPLQMLPRSVAPSRAIVIGGGVAGVSIARELARKGVGVTLLEKAGQLCAGATWHAAGLVTRFGGSPKIKKVHVRALREMTALHEAHDIGLHITGSIRLIEKGNPDRLTEAKQHVAMAALYDDPGLPTTLITPEEVAALHPLVDTSGVDAGVFTPRDGDVDPTLLTTCVAGLAKADGAEFVHNAEVETIERRSDGTFEARRRALRPPSPLLSPHPAPPLAPAPRLTSRPPSSDPRPAARQVRTGAGAVFEADAVVNAAGLWSRRFSRQLGLEQTHPPASVVEHRYSGKCLGSV